MLLLSRSFPSQSCFRRVPSLLQRASKQLRGVFSLVTGNRVSASPNLPSSDFPVSGKPSDNAQNGRLECFVKKCAKINKSDVFIDFFGKISGVTVGKVYNVAIRNCLEKATSRPNEEESFNLYIQALQHFILMKEKGFPLEEVTECLFLICSSHLSMGREFHLYKELIEDGVGDPYSILGFYEMLLWINCEFEDKIRDLCSFINVDAEDKGRGQAEIYLLAFCEKDRKKDILKMLEMVDITKMPSGESVACVFRSLGRLFLVNQFEELIMLLRASESATVDTSYLIFEFVSNIPGLKVEKVISKFNNLHKEFKLQPSVAAYENLITYCCNLLKVREAFAVVESMCESGLTLSADTFIPILCAIEKMKMGDVDLTMDMLVKDINLNDPKSALDKFAAVNILQASLDDEEEVWEETDKKDLNK